MASRLLPSLFRPRGLAVDPILGLHQEMNRLFDDAFRNFGWITPSDGGGAPFAAVPRLDVQDSDREICISVEVPGVQSSDLDVRLDGSLLTISGEKKNERESREQSMRVTERSFGTFLRSVQLPFEPKAEQVQAEFKNGVLTLHVPRLQPEDRSQRIEVRSSEGSALPVDATTPSASSPTSGAPNQAESNASPLGAEVASNSSASTGSINQGEQLREQGLGMSVGGVGEQTVESTSGTVPTDQFTSESQLGEKATRPGLPDLTRGA